MPTLCIHGSAWVVRVTAFRKITALAFLVSTWIQFRIDGGEVPHIGRQILPYVLLTSGEVMVDITCLEFSYTQAPRTMKFLIMPLFMLLVAVGNLFIGSKA